MRTVRWAPKSYPPEVKYEQQGQIGWYPVSKQVISAWLKAGIVVWYNPVVLE